MYDHIKDYCIVALLKTTLTTKISNNQVIVAKETTLNFVGLDQLQQKFIPNKGSWMDAYKFTSLEQAIKTANTLTYGEHIADYYRIAIFQDNKQIS